ncbi:MAG TPA: hypothetical protein VJR58_03625 [Vineibacter sp.]|nr:hypothetical protein [Vineibacter sp.]
MSSSAIGDSPPQQNGLVDAIAQWFARFGKHGDVDGLLSLDDHLLADIGVSRGVRTYMAQHRRLPDCRHEPREWQHRAAA